MKRSHLKYYDRYSKLAHVSFLWGAMRADSRVKKLSLLNRQRDYVGLADDPKLLALHAVLNRHLLEAAQTWDTYDYGEGYFYQSLDVAGISGLRDTRARVEAMGLERLLAGRTVLDIGCHSGFLALALAGAVERVVGFDLNPHLIAMGRSVADYLGIGNVELLVSSFEDFASNERFDAVLSFANHSTYDGNTKQSLDEYFHRCRSLLRPGGLLLFESHAPQHEGAGLERVCSMIGGLFDIRERRELSYGTFLDRGRTFVVAERTRAADADERQAPREDAAVAATCL